MSTTARRAPRCAVYIKALEISEIDVCINENGRAHRTSEYDLMEQDLHLVVRRGQKFVLNLKLDRDYDPEIDEITLIFNLKSGRGKRIPKISVPFVTSDKELGKSWEASLDSIGHYSMKITIMSPADAHIGKYAFSIESKYKNQAYSTSRTSEVNFYLIFNPWCSDDQVYLEDENCRHEYVLAEEGLIWVGNVGQLNYISWLYGQFSKDILDCVLYILEELADLRSVDMKNPIMISRGLSLAINTDSDTGSLGVLRGKWKEPYTDGTRPTKWMGSEKILQKYYDTKKTVLYGQCWVFGGVLATACRALGLPCRVVTNFASAHDANGNLRIEQCVDDNHAVIGEKSEGIWNFHVWNEVWMKRPDLEDPKYDGWQAVDATPQEPSVADDPKYGGQFACGPIPVLAIKLGELDKSYDGPFVYAAINADVYYYKDSDNGPKMFDSIDKDQVGQCISTKAVGSFSREDLTDMYKFPENSEENRECFERGRNYCKDLSHKDLPSGNKSDFHDVKFSLDLSENVMIGQTFSAKLTIRNQSFKETYTTLTRLCCASCDYTGRSGLKIKEEKAQVFIKPRCTKVVQMNISWDDYKQSLICHQSSFKIICTTLVKDVGFDYINDAKIQLLKPKMDIKVETIVGDNEEMLEVKASFINPLPHELTNGKFRISGPTLRKIYKSKLENVSPGEVVSCKISDIPKVKEISSIIVKFDSNELQGVEGFLPIEIRNSPAPAARLRETFSSSIMETFDTIGSSVRDLKMRLFNHQ